MRRNVVHGAPVRADDDPERARTLDRHLDILRLSLPARLGRDPVEQRVELRLVSRFLARCTPPLNDEHDPTLCRVLLPMSSEHAG
jgi:hypothetical protein